VSPEDQHLRPRLAGVVWQLENLFVLTGRAAERAAIERPAVHFQHDERPRLARGQGQPDGKIRRLAADENAG